MNLNQNRINAYQKTAGKTTSAETPTKNIQPFSFAKFDKEELPVVKKTTKSPKEKTYIDELMGRDGLLKLTTDSSEKTVAVEENQYRKVAKFLLILGVDEASKILPHLPQEQVEKIVPEIASIRSVTKEEETVILAEFKSIVEKQKSKGGVDTARTILTKAFGEDKAKDLIEKSIPYPEGKPFEYLKNIDSEKLNFLLKDESIPIQTLVLSKITPAIAASFINGLDAQSKKDVVMRLAKMQPMSPEIVNRVDNAMFEKFTALEEGRGSEDRIDGRGALAKILKKMDIGSERDILSTLTEFDPDLSDNIKERLFTIDDVINSDDRFIQETLRSMSETDIAFLIANKEQKLRDKILTNVSTTRGTVILEEETLSKPMRKRDVDEITNAFFTKLRTAWENGTLIIIGRDDEYV